MFDNEASIDIRAWLQYGPVCNFADTVSVTFMHPEPIGLLSHVFFSLTFPVILGLISLEDIHSKPAVEEFTQGRWFLDRYTERLTMGTIIQGTTQVLV